MTGLLTWLKLPERNVDGCTHFSITTPWPRDEQCEVGSVCVDESGPDRAIVSIPVAAKVEIWTHRPSPWRDMPIADTLKLRCCQRCLCSLARYQVQSQTLIYQRTEFTVSWSGERRYWGTPCS